MEMEMPRRMREAPSTDLDERRQLAQNPFDTASVPSTTEIDELAKHGHLKTGDTPGEDTFDDGMNHRGELAQGSTVTESGGSYREDLGPLDLTQRQEAETLAATSDSLSVVEDPEEEAKAAEAHSDIYAGEDDAAKWLRENDPAHPANQKRRKAA